MMVSIMSVEKRVQNINEDKQISKMQLAYEKIKESIVTDKYKPEQFLSARELCKELGISRTPVMDALRRLAYEGFVDHIPDKGMFVSRVRFGDMIELFEIREGIETIAARLCSLRKTDELIEKMENCLCQYEKFYRMGEYSRVVDFDNEFHMHFVLGARNERMLNYWHILFEQTKRGVFLSATDPERIEKSIMVMHRKILNAIKQGNGNLAEECVKEHYEEVLEFFKQYQIKNHYNIK